MEIRFSPHVTISQNQLAPKHEQICDNEFPTATQQKTNFYSIQYLQVTLSFKVTMAEDNYQHSNSFKEQPRTSFPY